jgi:ArsR family transcriptional regulator, arsenate/arsenite/antimonite-responsive transcriptional repressor
MSGQAPAERPVVQTSLRDAYVSFAKAIADPTRLEMLTLIGATGEYPCTALEERLPISKSTISYHIKILSQAGLVKVRREGRFFHYVLRREMLDFYMPELLPRLLSEHESPRS